MALTEEDKQWILTQLVRVETNQARAETNLVRVETNLERVETSLLTEFHKWAAPVEMRQRSHSAALRAFDAELEALDDRVKNLEAQR